MIIKEIYLAGGCFWGVQAFFNQLDGVIESSVGYANGIIENPTYQQVCTDTTDFVETLHIKYDNEVISLKELLDYFFMVIDPCSINKQGEDKGSQYRTGIYFIDDKEEEIKQYIAGIADNYEKPIVTEVLPLENFYIAEEYHQDYLVKNPEGYCHIDMSILRQK